MPTNVGIIADFNSANLARLMEKHCGPLAVTATASPFGQVMQTLLQPTMDFWQQPYDLIVLWTFPGSVVATFNDVLNFQLWSANELDRGVDEFAELVRTIGRRARNIFVPLWIEPELSAHRPSLEMKQGVGAGAALLRMNLRLIDKIDGIPGVVLFNTQRWVRQGGATAFSDKLWYLSKTPYAKSVFEEAAKDMMATLHGLRGLRKKVLILDLDNTIWGGIVGEIGWEAIQVGGHDPIGEAYLQFQRELKRLSMQGVLLAIVSKNEEPLALEAFERHPEMILRLRDFVGWRINWADKAQNVVELMRDLNLGLDSAVFLDDSPHERNRVRQALPDILVPEWPTDPMDYAKALRELRCFEGGSLSGEDRTRTAMYVSDRERRDLRLEAGSAQKWLETLNLEVHVEELSAANLERTTQLMNKTNQMNLTTRRLSAQELAAWASEAGHRLWTFSVRDKIGDYGLCGIASLAFRGAEAQLIDFVLSCRAMGRGVEEAIISVIADKVREAGVQRLSASYIATNKNKPCIGWIEQQPWFTAKGDGRTFLLDVNREIAAPTHIRMMQST